MRRGRGGLLAAVARPSPLVVTVPSPLPDGQTQAAFVVTNPGRYELWLGGSFVRRLTAAVDAKSIGSSREVINEAGGWTPLGTARLRDGAHRVTLSYGDSELYPGSGGGGRAGPVFPVGPLALAPVTGRLPITYVSPARRPRAVRQAVGLGRGAGGVRPRAAPPTRGETARDRS